jgi:hypothetical protein
VTGTAFIAGAICSSLLGFVAILATIVVKIQATWAVQDRIALEAAEEKSVEVKREVIAGRDRVPRTRRSSCQ